MSQLTVACPKPQLIDVLRAHLRTSSQHYAEQAIRFLRLTLLAAVPSLYDLIAGGQFDRKTLLAFILPVAETAYRQWFPALGAKRIDAVPGVTIVPHELGVAEKLPVNEVLVAPEPAKKTAAKKKTTAKKSASPKKL